MGSQHGLCVVPFGDGEYSFRLSLAGLAEIEAKFSKSFFAIAAGLQSRQATTSEISETIRIGLIGGGMAPVKALEMTRRYCDERPLDESRDVALVVALAGLARVHSDELVATPGEPEPVVSLSDSTSGKSSLPAS